MGSTHHRHLTLASPCPSRCLTLPGRQLSASQSGQRQSAGRKNAGARVTRVHRPKAIPCGKVRERGRQPARGGGPLLTPLPGVQEREIDSGRSSATQFKTLVIYWSKTSSDTGQRGHLPAHPRRLTARVVAGLSGSSQVRTDTARLPAQRQGVAVSNPVSPTNRRPDQRKRGVRAGSSFAPQGAIPTIPEYSGLPPFRPRSTPYRTCAGRRRSPAWRCRTPG